MTNFNITNQKKQYQKIPKTAWRVRSFRLVNDETGDKVDFFEYNKGYFTVLNYDRSKPETEQLTREFVSAGVARRIWKSAVNNDGFRNQSRSEIFEQAKEGLAKVAVSIETGQIEIARITFETASRNLGTFVGGSFEENETFFQLDAERRKLYKKVYE